MTLPLPLRNRLAELIVDALRAAESRQALGAIWRFCSEPGSSASAAPLPPGFPLEFFEQQGEALTLKGAYRRFRDDLCERVGRAWAVLSDRPFSAPGPSLADALDGAADLFDAGLYFEVHELLEPYWMRADGPARETLQGLIQVAIGFQHLANGNVEGARSLLDEGSARLLERSLERRVVGEFGSAVRRALEAIIRLGTEPAGAFDWSNLPPFPREG